MCCGVQLLTQAEHHHKSGVRCGANVSPGNLPPAFGTEFHITLAASCPVIDFFCPLLVA